MSRRDFVSLTGLAALGLAAGCAAPGPARRAASIAVTETPPSTPYAGRLLWHPYSELSTVSVAADARLDGYPALWPDAPEAAPAFVVLEHALRGLGHGSPVACLRALAGGDGRTILIKPNWVEPGSWRNAKITHPSLVLALAAWAAEAMGERGNVWIGEGTSEGRDLPRVLESTSFEGGLGALRLQTRDRGFAPIGMVDLNTASVGRLSVDLGGLSRFAAREEAMYDAHGDTMGAMGDGRVGRYLLARPVIDADLVIDVAKAKVHSSAAVTLTLKNLLGIVPSADGPDDGRLKDVPHYSATDREAGTRYAGNRTIGGSAADLAAALLYTSRDGSLQRKAQRKVLCIVDGIVSGASRQFDPDPVKTGWVVAGLDPVAVDHVAARCMGYDPLAVPSLAPARAGSLLLGTGEPAAVRIVHNAKGAFSAYFSRDRAVDPADGWGRSVLTSFGPASPDFVVRDGVLTLRAASDVAAARLESAEGFAPLTRRPGDKFTIDVPGGVNGLRLALTGAHFGHAELVLRG